MIKYCIKDKCVYIIDENRNGDNMETMQQYVIRKLKDGSVNIVKMSKDIPMNRSKIYRIMNGQETSASSMQKLNDYLKKAAD